MLQQKLLQEIEIWYLKINLSKNNLKRNLIKAVQSKNLKKVEEILEFDGDFCVESLSDTLTYMVNKYWLFRKLLYLTILHYYTNPSINNLKFHHESLVYIKT